MTLRKHQEEFRATIDGIISGSPIRTIYVSACPGGGKSIIPIIAGRLIEAGLADKLIWIAPRLSLVDQAEREFINPYFRRLLGHQLEIRSSKNEYNPCRGLHGFATTYNAVGLDEDILLGEFERRRYILVCDEFHHIQENSLWHQKIAPLFSLAAYRVMLSGTLERGDGTRIAFLPYKMNGGGLTPDLQDTEEIKIIRYAREDALLERAILPLTFHLHDGQVNWQSKTGRHVQVSSMDRMESYDASKAIYTALHTEFAEELLRAGLKHWLTCREKNPGAKCLIVCSDIAQAKKNAATLKKWGLAGHAIATSDDSAKALSAIKKLKSGALRILVAVAMVYEGMDCPSATHIISLTRIRSVPWIEQMTARVNRIDPQAGPYEDQQGHIFAPADPLFKEIVSRIEAEQAAVLVSESNGKGKSGEKSARKGEFSLLPSPGGIIPVSSKLTAQREVVLGGGLAESADDIPLLTSSERETDILNQIEDHIRRYSFQNRYNPKKINAEVFDYFGKRRREMTLPELQACLAHVRAAYPMSFIRGAGHRRVPTKAQPVAMRWAR